MMSALYSLIVGVLGVTLGIAIYLGRASWRALQFFFPKHPNDPD